MLAVCDTNNHALRAIHLDDGSVEVLAGNGQQSVHGDLGVFLVYYFVIIYVGLQIFYRIKLYLIIIIFFLSYTYVARIYHF